MSYHIAKFGNCLVECVAFRLYDNRDSHILIKESACKYLIKYLVKFHVGVPTWQTLQQYARPITTLELLVVMLK